MSNLLACLDFVRNCRGLHPQTSVRITKIMKTSRWFSPNRLTLHLRIINARILLASAAAMDFVAAKSSSPSKVAKSSSPPVAAKLGGKHAAGLEAKFARNKAFADHFKTLIGRTKSSGEGSRLDGPAQ